MGRHSKFTFPLPGRRSKPALLPTISAPLTKVQRILGNAELNIDSSSAPKDFSRQWDTTSNSCISICVSDTTTEHGDDIGSGTHDGSATGTGAARMATVRWEDESAVIPPNLALLGMAAGGGGNEGITDASSLRRRYSSSTIDSFYDKSKLPLSISQQTANSAIAKGLPPKIQAMLDSSAPPPTKEKKKKKKPARLDLSLILPKQKLSRCLIPPSTRSRGPILGPDLMTKSPSIMSLSTDPTPSPAQTPVSAPKLRKKLSKSNLQNPRLPLIEPRKALSMLPSRNCLTGREAPAPLRALPQPTKSKVNLPNLYDHYEQRSFHDVMNGVRKGRISGILNSSIPTTSSAKKLVPPFSKAGSRTGQPNKFETPVSTIGIPPNRLCSIDGSNDSILSRQTRTSKASKRTSQSFMEVNLKQTSVLSLSSESDEEEDLFDAPMMTALSAPTSASLSHNDTSPRSAPGIGDGPQLAQMPRRPSLAAPPHSLSVSEKPTNGRQPPRISMRSSSLNHGSPSPSHSTSQVRPPNVAKAHTRFMSLGSQSDPIHEGARIISMFPAPSQYSRFSTRSGTGGRVASQQLTSLHSGQPTRPLSPNSVEFCLQSQPASFTHGKASSRAGPEKRDSLAGRRMMAVTRQEEVLLAALRQRRARTTQENAIAGLEEEQDVDVRQWEQQKHQQHHRKISEERTRAWRPSIDGRPGHRHRASASVSSHSQSIRPRPQMDPSSVESANSVLDEEDATRGQISMMLDRAGYAVRGASTRCRPEPLGDTLVNLDDAESSDDGELNRPLQSPAELPAEPLLLGVADSTPSLSSRCNSRRSSQRTVTKNSERHSALHFLESRSSSPSPRSIQAPTPTSADNIHVRILEERDSWEGVPRPDSPVNAPPPEPHEKKSPQVRLSAVGGSHMVGPRRQNNE